MTNAAALAQSLDAATAHAAATFAGRREDETGRRPAPEKWCAKEILGHLVDSAANNHRRFVIGQDATDLLFDGYAQEQWVARQRYADAKWDDLVSLWRAYNHHLARIISVMPDEVLQRLVTRHSFDRIAMRQAPADEPSTLGYLIEDYIYHLQHHLAQIRTLLDAGAESPGLRT